jgi:cytochrome c-type biogenesis protein CcmE
MSSRRDDGLDESADAAALDLAPRVRTAKTRRTAGVGVVLALLLAAAAFVVFKGLSEATMFFCNADEVGQRDGCRADDGRFRIQGIVDDGSIVRGNGVIDFTLSFGGATVPVHYAGSEPSDLFQAGTPAVVEGRLDGDTFAGDRILVKHTEEYREKNPDRVPEDAP